MPHQVDGMRNFIMINTLAVAKITKKHDKQSPKQLQWDMVSCKACAAFIHFALEVRCAGPVLMACATPGRNCAQETLLQLSPHGILDH